MKFTKKVKYNYKLTEETLEKDIEVFIEVAKKGEFHMDRYYNNEGLKIIKQYLRILNEKFKSGEFTSRIQTFHKSLTSNLKTILFYVIIAYRSINALPIHWSVIDECSFSLSR